MWFKNKKVGNCVGIVPAKGLIKHRPVNLDIYDYASLRTTIAPTKATNNHIDMSCIVIDCHILCAGIRIRLTTTPYRKRRAFAL